jgi:cytidylate kinase
MKRFQDLRTPLLEGVYDPNIFKAIFLAGGPGSGKSLVAGKSTGGHGLKLVNSDPAFELLLKQAGLSLKMPPEEFERKEKVRAQAKKITAKQKANYVEGRLGLIIDGTGKDAEKILFQKRHLEELGYDTYMIFVNTSVDVALANNAQRPRSLPDADVVKMWKAVQNNIGQFSNMFRQGFIVVDNNDPVDPKDLELFKEIWKRVRGLLKKKVTNTRAQNWISMELAKKRR